MPAGHWVYQVAIFKMHENLCMLSILIETDVIKELMKIHEYNPSTYIILNFSNSNHIYKILCCNIKIYVVLRKSFFLFLKMVFNISYFKNLSSKK